jgi:hypothetical protein
MKYIIIIYEDDYLVCIPYDRLEYYKNVGKKIKSISNFDNIEKAYKDFKPLVETFNKRKCQKS